MAIQLLAAQKVGPWPATFAWVVSAWPRARSGCRRPCYWQEVRVSYVKSSFDVISHDLLLCDSSLFSVERINEKVQFLSTPNQISTLFLPTRGKWVHSKNWVLWKKFVKNFTFGSGCMRTVVSTGNSIPSSFWVIDPQYVIIMNPALKWSATM